MQTTLILERADLWIAVVVMTGLGAAMGAGVYVLLKDASRLVLSIAGVAATVLLLLFGFAWADSLWGTHLIPLPSFIIYGQPAYLLAIILAAVLLRHPIPRWRSIPLAIVLVLFAAGELTGPLREPPPACRNRWRDGVCLQTSDSSCSAAAAATLLRQRRIPATEQEMARLCLTNADGTLSRGLYRGLHLKTKGTSFRVKVGRTTVAELQASDELPVIISVLLTPEVAARAPVYAGEWGWTPGLGHTVVVLGFPGDGLVTIGDPGVGRERWALEHLRDLMTGEYITIVPMLPRE
jgi:hypothetical protein